MEVRSSGDAPQGVGTEANSRAGAAWNGHDGRAVADFLAGCKAAGMDGVVKYGALEMKFWASPDASLVKKTEKLQLDTVSVRMAELERRLSMRGKPR